MLKTGGTLAAGYDVISKRQVTARLERTQAGVEFGEPRMRVVVGYVRGAWHIEVHLPERGQ